jgi:hypothetical protein
MKFSGIEYFDQIVLYLFLGNGGESRFFWPAQDVRILHNSTDNAVITDNSNVLNIAIQPLSAVMVLYSN